MPQYFPQQNVTDRRSPCSEKHCGRGRIRGGISQHPEMPCHHRSGSCGVRSCALRCAPTRTRQTETCPARGELHGCRAATSVVPDEAVVGTMTAQRAGKKGGMLGEGGGTLVDPTKMSLSTPPVTSALPAFPYPVTICTRSAGAPAPPTAPIALHTAHVKPQT